MLLLMANGILYLVELMGLGQSLPDRLVFGLFYCIRANFDRTEILETYIIPEKE